MGNSPRPVECADSLDALVEKYTHNLFEVLSRSHTLTEMMGEVKALSELIDSYRQRDEMLEKLLDDGGSQEQRSQILRTLQAQDLSVGKNKEELTQLYEHSHNLIERSVSLLARAQLEINRSAHQHTGYALEICGYCKGIVRANGSCPGCKGQGSVLARQPARPCPKCDGEGRPSPKDRTEHYRAVCLICRGSGWIMALNG
jgi:hypothetical protein